LTLQKLLEEFPPGQRNGKGIKVLCAGDKGAQTVIVKLLLPDAEVVSTSLYEAGKSLLYNNHKNESIELDLVKVRLDEDEWPFESGYFDIVLLWEVLEHLYIDPIFALFESRRVLAKGGIIQITTPNPNSCRMIDRLFRGHQLTDFPAINYWGVAHPHEVSFQQLQYLIQHTGFKILQHMTFMDNDNSKCSFNFTDENCLALSEEILAKFEMSKGIGASIPIYAGCRQMVLASADFHIHGKLRFPPEAHYNPSMFPAHETVKEGKALPWKIYKENPLRVDNVKNASLFSIAIAPAAAVVTLLLCMIFFRHAILWKRCLPTRHKKLFQ
jgi:SAM-dependent methyltransferase